MYQREQELPRRFKGLPLQDGTTVEQVGALGWNALDDLEYPALLLHERALRQNLHTMAAYCVDGGLLLAPHAKTSLSPQIIKQQLARGAWAMTAATPAQVRGLYALGVRRILLANVLVDEQSIRWVATHLLSSTTPSQEFSCYVDSVEGVDLLDRILRDTQATRRLHVLVEVGYPGGRTGTRSIADSVIVGRRAAASSGLTLAGVAGFEGLMPTNGDAVPAGLPTYLDSIGQTARALQHEDLFTVDAPIVSAGGSSYFDLVAAQLGPKSFDFPVRTVLRSGCYVTHDHGIYHRTSPLDGRSTSQKAAAFLPALELLASVWSRPEPRLAIVGFGRRDVPVDDQLPIVLGRFDDSGIRQSLPGVEVTAVNDQHAYVRVPDDLLLLPGDLIGFGISHPCGAFDRWPALCVVSDDYQVTDVVTTDL